MSAPNSSITEQQATPRRVIKLGGSVLERDDWRLCLNLWLARQSAAVNVLVVGGGAFVDRMRECPELEQRLSATQIHWLAIRAMTMQAKTVLAFLPNAQWLPSPRTAWGDFAPNTVLLVDAWRFMREEDPLLPNGPLPASWDVTSDSIAARVAQAVNAFELVLLKSALPCRASTRESAAADRYVDGYFPRVTPSGLRVRCVNSADPTFPEQGLPPEARL